MQYYQRLLQSIEKLYVFVSSIAFAIIFVVNIADILSRLIKGTSIVYTQDISILCFSWSVFIGMAVVLERNMDPQITLFLDKLVPQKYHRYFDMLVYVLIIIFMITVLNLMIGYVQLQSIRTANYLPISYMYFSLPIVFSFAYMLLSSIRKLIICFKGGE